MTGNVSIGIESLQDIQPYYRPEENDLRWPHVFVLPGWLSAWWGVFGEGYEQLVMVGRKGAKLIGIAPLKRLGDSASFIGDVSVCDYLDFITASGYEAEFFRAVLDSLSARGVRNIDLATLRPESVVATVFRAEAGGRGLKVTCQEADVSYETVLPATIEAYLANLDGKQRHELERKQRNLEKQGEVRLTIYNNFEAGAREQELFFNFMTRSRNDKAGFLTDRMKDFFGRIFNAMAAAGCLRLAFIELNGQKVASVLCFAYNDRIYLYNSGYDPAFAELSVGVISKLWSIRWAIQQNMKTYDFLKGAELYKARLGGQKVSLAGCHIDLG